jgi:hypothetical protein
LNDFVQPDETNESEDVKYYVYEEPLILKAVAIVGWAAGWVAYWLARFGLVDGAEALIDEAIMMRRANPGAIRAIGYLNGRRGLPALRRGRLIVQGKIHDRGPFANKGFFATYHVAAPNKARALALIKRFEWDAIPESLEIDDGELEYPDTGAEGVLWIAGGRCFYSEGN